METNTVHNLQYGPGTRLVRGLDVREVRFLSEFGPVMILMPTIVVATKVMIPNWVRNVFHSPPPCSHGQDTRPFLVAISLF